MAETWRDATGLAALVAAGEVSPAELVEAACARIQRIDPELGAVPVRFFDAANPLAALLAGPHSAGRGRSRALRPSRDPR